MNLMAMLESAVQVLLLVMAFLAVLREMKEREQLWSKQSFQS